ncbi:hypothetical protein C0Q88_07390 [Ralstonia pickettii]|uniref:Uncharacterized protein n=1 Tax=Ralstonia pickettii TaxID=329 RepID=A0A2N4TXP6_RALPI|nr:hypothetical protein [Ralstonia pickettii]PLC44494.1 hypothetical protein C0Q88_07390 [Ralstonia pickettii]
MKLKLLGLDPSLSNFGIAKMTLDLTDMSLDLDDLVLVKTEPEQDKKKKKAVRQNSLDLERGRILHDALIVHAQGFQIAVAEVPVGSQSARAMASYGVCIGVLAACPIPMIQVTPSEVKMAGFGVKTATKDEMIEWALQTYPAGPWLTRKTQGQLVPIAANEHLADAVAAVHAGILTDQFRQATALMRGLKAA